MTLSGMLRDIENFRSKDQKVVIEDYKNKLKLAEEQRKIAQAKLDQHLNEVANQENQYNINTALVRNTIKDIDDPKVKSGIRSSIRAIQNSTKQTWEFFCSLNSLQPAIIRNKWGTISCLLEAGIDYKIGKDSLLAAYSMALELKKDIGYENSSDKQKIYNLMYQRILKDVPQASKDNNLWWFVNAVDIAHELINSPIPEKHGMTPAMQLAKDNQLEALMVIDQHLCEDEFDDEGASSVLELNFFNTVDDSGKTAFTYAFERGHKELSLWLFSKSKLELTPIEQACKEGNVTQLDRLLTDISIDLSISNNACLLWAVMQNHKDIVAKLIASNKVDLQANGNIALITAIRCAYSDLSYLDIAKQLIDAGCDINAQNSLLLTYAKDRFKKAANIEPETTNLTELKILDFVYQTKAVLTAKKLLPVRQSLAATRIQYLWGNYKISKEEFNEKKMLITNAKDGASTIDLEEQQQIKEFFLKTPLTEVYRQKIEDELNRQMTEARNQNTKNIILHKFNSNFSLGRLSSKAQCAQAEAIAGSTGSDLIIQFYNSLTDQVAKEKVSRLEVCIRIGGFF